MITDAILGVFFGFADWLLSLLPTVDVPDWLSASGPMAQVFTYAGQMGVWFPVQLLVSVLSALIVVWGVSFVIKLIRIVASFFTAGGGSAA